MTGDMTTCIHTSSGLAPALNKGNVKGTWDTNMDNTWRNVLGTTYPGVNIHNQREEILQKSEPGEYIDLE